MNKVLFILRIPPPYGGGEIASKALFDAIKDNKQFRFKLFSRKAHSKSKQASANPIYIINGLGYILSTIFSIVWFRPNTIYIGLPKGFMAFIRNSIIILFCSLFNISVIAELHGMSFPFDKNPKKRKYLLFVLNRISKIRVLGDSIAQYFRVLGFQGEISTVPNGISVPYQYSHLKKQIGNDTYNFLYFGAISLPKGFYKVIKLFYRLYLKGNRNFNLHVVGEWVKHNDSESFYKSEEYKMLKSHIVFHGILIGNKKWEVISLCHYLIHLTSFDGQPLTIIETMGMGIPSISTFVGTIPEMINNNCGFLIIDENEAYSVLEKILDNKVNYVKMSKAASENYNNKFTINKMATGIINLVRT
jgi:glycosyltransferase involved in cell wall biosynthesis